MNLYHVFAFTGTTAQIFHNIGCKTSETCLINSDAEPYLLDKHRIAFSFWTMPQLGTDILLLQYYLIGKGLFYDLDSFTIFYKLKGIGFKIWKKVDNPLVEKKNGRDFAKMDWNATGISMYIAMKQRLLISMRLKV